MWSTGRLYAQATTKAVEMIAGLGQPYILLRPPAVPSPILAIARQADAPEFCRLVQIWATSNDVLDAQKVQERLGHELPTHYFLPERDGLLFPKWFAETADAAVALYSCETWGGHIEHEWCWLFGKNREAAFIYLDPLEEWGNACITANSVFTFRWLVPNG